MSSNATAELLEGSALRPPEDMSPNLTNRSDAQSGYYVSAVLCTVIPGVCLLLHLYTKWRLVQRIDITDGAVVTSFLLLLVEVIVFRLAVAEGAGVHMWNLQLKHFIKMQYWGYVFQIVYAPAIFLIKFALLLQYIRLLAPNRTVNRTLFIGAQAMIVITLVFYVIATMVEIFSCSPREKIWNPLITEGHCINTSAEGLITAAFNMVSDIVIFLLPAKTVWNLQISLSKKLRIVALFATGLVACIATVTNIVYQARSVQPEADDSYTAAFVGFWVLAELVEAKRENLQAAFSYLARPFTSVSSLKNFVRLPNIDKLAPSVTATHRGTGHHFQSEADLTGYKLEPYPSPPQHFNTAKMERPGHYLARIEHLHDADFQQLGHESGSSREEIEPETVV